MFIFNSPIDGSDKLIESPYDNMSIIFLILFRSLLFFNKFASYFLKYVSMSKLENSYFIGLLYLNFSL